MEGRVARGGGVLGYSSLLLLRLYIGVTPALQLGARVFSNNSSLLNNFLRTHQMRLPSQISLFAAAAQTASLFLVCLMVWQQSHEDD